MFGNEFTISVNDFVDALNMRYGGNSILFSFLFVLFNSFIYTFVHRHHNNNNS